LIPLVPDEILYGKMDPKLEEKASIGIGPLVLALAKTFHWAGLYGPDHAVLAKRVSEVHNALLSRLPLEPDGHLLFGIARDKVLYQNEFLGEGQDLVARLTENLYLRQVATVGFDGRVTPEGLLALLRRESPCLLTTTRNSSRASSRRPRGNRRRTRAGKKSCGVFCSPPTLLTGTRRRWSLRSSQAPRKSFRPFSSARTR
jgi:hypothetical protein